MTPIAQQLADLSTAGLSAALCGSEKIHLPGSIQQQGALLALDPARELAIVAASANIAQYLPGGLPREAPLLGRRLGSLLGQAFCDELQALLDAGGLHPGAPWEMIIQACGTVPELEASVHHQAGLVIVEIEAVTFQGEAETLAATRVLQRCIAELRRTDADLAVLAGVVSRAVRLLTGYERVLVYKFDEDWHGQALAEDKVADWHQSLSGQRFHSSNIPPQARDLYLRCPLRCLWDRDAAQVPLHVDPVWAATSPSGPAIDLSFAKLRSFSPVHLAIHRSLNINGTMSLSLIQDDRLWGLVVCHHRLPHPTTPGQQAAALALANAFSVRVEPAERAEAEQARRADAQRLGQLLAHMAGAEDVGPALTRGDITIGSLFGVSGAAVLYDGKTMLVGDTPPEAAVLDLANWLRERPEEVFQTDRLPILFPPWEPHATDACGVLAVFLAADRREMLLWFRPEKPALVDSDSTLSPEQAAAFRQITFTRVDAPRRGFALPWADWEQEIAIALGNALTEVIIRSLRRISVLNEQLRQSQKMEAVGQLTGGIAHDFNNMLAGIMGSLEMTRIRIEQGRIAELDRYIAAAMTSAQRAAAMTHRLLAFSRQQTLDPKPTDLNRLTSSMGELIRSTVGSAIRVESVMPDGLWKTLCDFNQLENALLNLAINARDAMPDGGQLTIEASNVHMDGAYARHHNIADGQYVALSVTDTGTGMTMEVVERVFDPFFTTKPQGQGTGLGLSMVYGFVTQSGGYARIYSEPGRGTTVRLYLPRWTGADTGAAETTSIASSLVARSGKAVLVVDDEAIVRMLVGDTLRDLGYEVTEAHDGNEAMHLNTRCGPFDMMVSDVGLPGGLNGRRLAENLRVTSPALPVLFITGFAENAVLGSGMLDPGMQVISKPFSLAKLAEKVKAMIG